MRRVEYLDVGLCLCFSRSISLSIPLFLSQASTRACSFLSVYTYTKFHQIIIYSNFDFRTPDFLNSRPFDIVI